MLNQTDARRRWLGLMCLGLAAGLLIWGQTVLKPHLDGVLYLIYWSLCFCFTIAAIIIALVDMRALRQRTRQQHHELLERTLEDVEKGREAKKKNGPATDGNDESGIRQK